MLFSKLSDDEVINICKFLAVQCLGKLSACSSSINRCCQQDDLWSESLMRTFPSLVPFSSSMFPSDVESNCSYERSSFMNGSYPIQSSKLKMKNFSDRTYTMSSVGELQTFRSRLLHRSVTDQAGVSYIFGGASTVPNPSSGSFRDVWKVLVHENTQQINFSRIIVESSGNFHHSYSFKDSSYGIVHLGANDNAPQIIPNNVPIIPNTFRYIIPIALFTLFLRHFFALFLIYYFTLFGRECSSTWYNISVRNVCDQHGRYFNVWRNNGFNFFNAILAVKIIRRKKR